jgi:hypothetical protein
MDLKRNPGGSCFAAAGESDDNRVLRRLVPAMPIVGAGETALTTMLTDIVGQDRRLDRDARG